jgi:O-methyltransferase
MKNCGLRQLDSCDWPTTLYYSRMRFTSSRMRRVYNNLRDPGSELRYIIAEIVARKIAPEVQIGDRTKLWPRDPELRRIWDQIEGSRSERRLERVWNVQELVRALDTVPGDTVECGVYRGLTSYVILHASRGFDSPPHHYGLDSFAGLSTPAYVDGDHWSASDLSVGPAIATSNLQDFAERVTLLHGWIPEVLTGIPEGKTFRFVHIDVDLYDPTKLSLEFFAPRLSEGGMIVCDDYGYGTCPGARQAVLEFVDQSPEWRVLELSSGQGVISRQLFT